MTNVSRWVSVFCGAAAALALSTWGTHMALAALLGDSAGPAPGGGRGCAVVTACPPYRYLDDRPPAPESGQFPDTWLPVAPPAPAPTGQPDSPSAGASPTAAPAGGGPTHR
ncbi:hypothetical protein HC031_20700 [Planosporangium thailandense]|uniref:Secreted protein n=1 Tax=Planosporangium thailandense TaxID=765197 RepID=A0ABX0Y3W5_9ACTN|nr:hypothetical protein [Planosporangium thailandense]NJC72117.1 hypothetical protein [Planosporangium thailandense]